VKHKSWNVIKSTKKSNEKNRKTMFREWSNWWQWMRTFDWGISFTLRRVLANARWGLRQLPHWNWYLWHFCWIYLINIRRWCLDTFWSWPFDEPPFGAVQFTIDEVQSVLMELIVVSKDASLEDIRFLFLRSSLKVKKI
jgi:hypothetical protein